jgi:hypothetical protein
VTTPGEHVAQNPPLSAAGLSLVAINLLAAFGNLTDQQLAAVGGAIFLIAAFVAQRFTTPGAAS